MHLPLLEWSAYGAVVRPRRLFASETVRFWPLQCEHTQTVISF